MLKRLLIFLLSNLLLLGAGLYGIKKLTIYIADAEAQTILTDARRDDSIATAKNATRILYENFGKDGYQNMPGAGNLRPYLTHRYMPEIFRIPHGAIELTMMDGWCDDAARALVYTLEKENIAARQWNMQGPRSAHSAVIMETKKGRALLDPFYGYTSITDGTMNDPIVAKNAPSKMLEPFDKKSNKKFYEHFNGLFMGAQGEPLTITAKIPRIDKPLQLGIINGNAADTRGNLLQNNMTITWDYIGHKYDRAWTRELVANQPLQVEITLTRKPDKGLLKTLSPFPAVNENKLRWNLAKNEKIIATDGLSPISRTRMKSYIDVDQIVITPQGDTP